MGCVEHGSVEGAAYVLEWQRSVSVGMAAWREAVSGGKAYVGSQMRGFKLVGAA